MGGARKRRVSREQQSAAIPVRNDAVRVERNEKGEAVLVIRHKRGRLQRLASRVLSVPLRDQRITLDEVGTFVWDRCDGKATVGQIVEQVAKRYKLQRREAEVSLLRYLRTLSRRRLVGVLVPPEAHDARRD